MTFSAGTTQTQSTQMLGSPVSNGLCLCSRMGSFIHAMSW